MRRVANVLTLSTLCLATLAFAHPQEHDRSAAARFQAGAAQQPPAKPPTATGPGRVVVTIAVEGLRIPGVIVALRNVDGNIVIARTTSDAIGQVTFPDVPAGRYVVQAVREGFADGETTPFTVRADRPNRCSWRCGSRSSAKA